MEDPCRIRRASIADIDAVVAIEREAFSDAWPRETFAVHLQDLFLLAEAGGEPVGFLIARQAADQAEVLDLAVSSAARGRGIGTQLVRAALAALQDGAAETVYLEVRLSNRAARAVYARIGFREVGRRRRYYQDPIEDALVLAYARGAGGA